MVPPPGVAAPSGGAPVDPVATQSPRPGRTLLIVAVVLAAVALPLAVAVGYALLKPPYQPPYQSSQTGKRVPEDARHHSTQDQEVILGAMRIADAVGSCYSDHWYVEYEDDPTAEDGWISPYGLAADYLDGPWPVNPYTGEPMREVSYYEEKSPGDFTNEAPWTEKSSGLIIGYIVVTLSTGETYSVVYEF